MTDESNTQWVVVWERSGHGADLDADLAVSLLEGSGLPVRRIPDSTAPVVFDGFGGPMLPVRLLVPTERADEARELLGDEATGASPADTPLTPRGDTRSRTWTVVGWALIVCGLAWFVVRLWAEHRPPDGRFIEPFVFTKPPWPPPPPCHAVDAVMAVSVTLGLVVLLVGRAWRGPCEAEKADDGRGQ